MEAIQRESPELELEEKPLTLVEKIQSARWQTRKEVYVYLADCLRAGQFLDDQESSVFAFVEPWLKNMATDTNLICQTEGLQTLLVFVNYSPTVSTSTLLLGDELIQKCQLNKQKWGDLVNSIVVSLLFKDHDSTLLGHVLKRFFAKNPKEACFSMICVRQALPGLTCSDNSAKNLLKAIKKAMVHNICLLYTSDAADE